MSEFICTEHPLLFAVQGIEARCGTGRVNQCGAGDVDSRPRCPSAASYIGAPQECCTQGVIKGVGDWEELLALTSVAERSVVRFEQESGSPVTVAFRSDERGYFLFAELPGECGPPVAVAE